MNTRRKTVSIKEKLCVPIGEAFAEVQFGYRRGQTPKIFERALFFCKTSAYFPESGRRQMILAVEIGEIGPPISSSKDRRISIL